MQEKVHINGVKLLKRGQTLLKFFYLVGIDPIMGDKTEMVKKLCG